MKEPPLLARADHAQRLSERQCLELARCSDTAALMAVAASLRDRGHGRLVSYSPKVFLPLTRLCRDVCHYCTFATTPRNLQEPYMSLEQVLKTAREAADQGCREALFTLGERPEARYAKARQALQALGCETTLEYLARCAGEVFHQTGLLPHINAGCMTEAELRMLRPVAASMGIMLESSSLRLCQRPGPHFGSPDKHPARRLATIDLAGRMQVPLTSGILIGIGETRQERIQSLLELRRSHEAHGHLQEVIIQNFRAKPGTRMALAPEPDLEELLWSIAVARLVFGAQMSIQAPPNLSPGVLPQLIAAGINDWGGVSPVSPDYVNPEAPWPHALELAAQTAQAGKRLQQRLTIYPAYVHDAGRWLDPNLRAAVLRAVDSSGLPRDDHWQAGVSRRPPAEVSKLIHHRTGAGVDAGLRSLLARSAQGRDWTEAETASLFTARDQDFAYLCQAADELRASVCGDTVRYVVNRNINYTNICYFKCRFCAFSKGRTHQHLRGRPYELGLDEIVRRSQEAWRRGATEVCMQGGIHPDYTGQTYLDICRAVKTAVPELHVHAFSPLEVWQGARTLGLSLREFLTELKAAGLGSLPGTAAEILDDGVRRQLCPDKLNSSQWLEVMGAAHAVGLPSTATIMYGHLETPLHWARHLLRIRNLQRLDGGFTELVPLPFVHHQAPLYLRGWARPGPTFREAVLMHAIARLVLHPALTHIQASWVKMGSEGVADCLAAGADDVGGTLMNESITRAAGATHGQELSPLAMERLIIASGRTPEQRTTLYQPVSSPRRDGLQGARPRLRAEALEV